MPPRRRKPSGPYLPGMKQTRLPKPPKFGGEGPIYPTPRKTVLSPIQFKASQGKLFREIAPISWGVVQRGSRRKPIRVLQIGAMNEEQAEHLLPSLIQTARKENVDEILFMIQDPGKPLLSLLTRNQFTYRISSTGGRTREERLYVFTRHM